MSTTFKLDPELKQRWVSALRSGKYRQGHNCLKDIDNDYCCLGVLADLINPEAWVYNSDILSFEWSSVYTEDPWLIKHSSKYLITDPIPAKVQKTLAKKNDFEKFSFLEIADYIEDNL